MTPVIPHTSPSFAELGVRDEIVRALSESGIEHPFAIQELTLPLALAGDDLIGQARTGMGKTFAFGVPLLQQITTDTERPLSGIPRALIVVPTRELCLQVYGDLTEASKYLKAEHEGTSRPLSVVAIYGGRPYEPQIEALQKGVDVVVGTPGPPARPGPAGSPAARRAVDAGARRGRRDARPRLPARHRADPQADPRQAAGDAVLGDHAGPDHHAGPHVHEPADAHPRRGRSRVGHPRHHRAVRLPRARARQGRDGRAASCRPTAAARR